VCGPHSHPIRGICQPDNIDRYAPYKDQYWRPCDQTIILGPDSCEWERGSRES